VLCVGMALTIERWPDVHGFLGAAKEFLAAREAEHCLLFGLCSTIANHPEVYPDPRFWTGHDHGRVVAAALRTPPHNLLLSQIDEPSSLAALAREVLACDELPGVLGPTGAARDIADAWSARSGRPAVRVMEERIFRLDRVIAPRPAPGHCREADERDRGRLTAWCAAFVAESTPDAPPSDPALAADRMLRRIGRVPYVWEDAGEVVAFAGAGGPTPHGVRIGPVYTPPNRRDRGYASNLIAEISRRQLAAGRRFCFLFTNLANPTANHIYQTIGYVPVVDVDQYRFPS